MAEQCRAWFFLHHLLLNRWARHFSHVTTIHHLNSKISSNRTYLEARFRDVGSEITRLKSEGSTLHVCNRCGYESSVGDASASPLFDHRCLVCDVSQTAIKATCPECGEQVIVGAACEGTCTCGHETDIENLLDEFGPTVTKHNVCDHCEIYCAWCEYCVPSVVRFKGGYLCLWCLEESPSASTCGWCNTLIMGFDAELSSIAGCTVCDGNRKDD